MNMTRFYRWIAVPLSLSIYSAAEAQQPETRKFKEGTSTCYEMTTQVPEGSLSETFCDDALTGQGLDTLDVLLYRKNPAKPVRIQTIRISNDPRKIYLSPDGKLILNYNRFSPQAALIEKRFSGIVKAEEEKISKNSPKK